MWVFACLVDQPTTHSIFAIVFSIVFSIVCFFTGNRPGPWIHPRIRRQRYDLFSKYQNFFLNFYEKSAFFLIWPQFSGLNPVYLHRNPLKNISSCPLKKLLAAIVGANPAKSIPQKPKPKPKAAPHTRPDTGKSPRKAKRNRENRNIRFIPYLCPVFLPRIAHFGI